MSSPLTTIDGDTLPAGTYPNGIHCFECAEDLPDTTECPEHFDDTLIPVVFSTTPLLGDPDRDDDYYHYGLDQYVYTLDA